MSGLRTVDEGQHFCAFDRRHLEVVQGHRVDPKAHSR
jgi:hypothetical protein